ncbi:hypothetical protein BSL78_16538 [Apostichopus japonicus]|uniref:Uncharacterized protein n=1 Tax=Stichopus japonicus TaxID=307972 RepID=A0A2G8KF63_STIJA|nr:hypothetical protein BSL78_16538 [Apostichopus japonicus]
MGAPTDAPPPYPDGEKADSPPYTEGTAYPPLLQQGYPQMGQLPQAQQPAPGYSAQQPAPGHQPQQNMRCGRRKLRDYVSDSEDSDEDCSDSNGVLQRLANLRYLREGNYKKPRRTCPFCSKSYIGSICREDPVILNVGKRLWDKGRAKENKKTEVRKSVMSDMRRLASLYLHFKEQKTIHASHFTLETGTSRDMFDRKNFSILSEAINAYTLNKEKASIKSGLKLGIYYLLKKASKVIKATHLVEENDIAAADIDRFVSVLELIRTFCLEMLHIK